jgi:hypothetical protein
MRGSAIPLIRTVTSGLARTLSGHGFGCSDGGPTLQTMRLSSCLFSSKRGRPGLERDIARIKATQEGPSGTEWMASQSFEVRARRICLTATDEFGR